MCFQRFERTPILAGWDGPSRRGALSVETGLAMIRPMDEPRLKISPRMRALMAYPKMAGRKPRILVLESQYWLDTASIHAAEALGWAVERVPTRMEGVLPRELIERLLTALTAFRPDFVLTINLSGMDERGLFARLFADLEIPYVTWFVDDPRTILMDRNIYGSEYAVALTWDCAYVPYLRARQFGAVHTLPLAVDPTRFNAEPAEGWVHPPTFVGNSMITFSRRERIWLDGAAAVAALVDGAFAAGRVTRENFGAGLEAMLGAAAGELDAEARRHAEMVLFIEGTRRLRHDFAVALAPEGLLVRGDADWQSVLENWGPFVDYTSELPGYYRDCEVNLNATSIQMPTTVNQRVFDCPAAGGFLLTDRQAALAELFDAEHEVAAYDSPEDAVEQLRYFRARPAARREIASKARRRVLGEHTYAHRLEKIASIVRERFGGAGV